MERFGEQFLHSKTPDLHTTGPVEHEKVRKTRKGEAASEKPADKIADWLQVLEQTHSGHEDDPRVLERIKEYYHREYVIKPEAIPESAFLLEQRIAEQLGHGKIEITDEFRQQKTDQIISDQKHSLDRWVNYLSSSDANYPMWAKYWAFKSMIKMGKLEKFEDTEIRDGVETKSEKSRFGNRDKRTIAPFPPMNPNALAKTFSSIEARARETSKQKKDRSPVPNQSTQLNDEAFQNLLNAENFSKLYTQFLIEIPEYSSEGLRETRGLWKVYKQGSDPDELVASLDGYPLEWCTANKDTARSQLQGGDFYLYYSINQDNNPVIPRVAIRMEGDSIAEVRGIAPGQNLDPYISDVVKTKMAEFPDGQEYEKKSSDMKRITEIHEKHSLGQELTKDDLVFLYEISDTIEGFGYERDPRIEELLQGRDKMADASIVFQCSPDQIARSVSEIKDDTKAYIGEWNPQVSQALPETIQYLYESFPEKKIFRKTIILSTNKTSKEYESELLKTGNKLSGCAKSMLKKLQILAESEQVDLVQFSAEQLGFPRGATLEAIYNKAKELNLDLCPPQTGPELRLQYTNERYNEYLMIAMEPIIDSDGDPSLFIVLRDGSKPWLYNNLGELGEHWDGHSEFVFRVRPSEAKK